MITKTTPALMIKEDDIEQLLLEWSSVSRWIKAHISPTCPPHRYEGDLIIEDECLIFQGRDIKEGKDCREVISLDSIIDVRVGFSEGMKANISPTFGIGGPMPFAVRYRNNGKTQTVYFNTTADNYTAHRNINNLRWYETLDEIVANYRPLEPVG